MSPRTVKAGGLAGLLAGALFIATTVIDQLAPVDFVYDSPNEYVFVAVITVAFLAAVGAVLGMWALKSRTEQLRRLGLAGAWSVGIGYGVVALTSAVSLVQGERSLVMVRIGAAPVILIGSVILGFVVLRTRLLPWWCGVLLIIAFPLGHFANMLLFRSAENILLALLWGSVGIALLVRATAPERPVTTETVQVG